MCDRSLLRRPSKPKLRCTALRSRSVQRLARCALRIQNVVTIELDIEEVERIPTSAASKTMLVPLTKSPGVHQVAINVDGMLGREVNICVRQVAPRAPRRIERANCTACRPNLPDTPVKV